MWGDRLSTKTTLNMFYGMDRRTGNPDNNARELVEEGRDLGFKLNTTGTVSVNAGWLKTIEYGLYGSYTDRHSYKSEIISGASGLYSTSTVDGSVTSSHQGVHIFLSSRNWADTPVRPYDDMRAGMTPWTRKNDVGADRRVCPVYTDKWFCNTVRL